jgi:hypothetical protein
MMSGVPKNILGVASGLLGLGRNIAITGGVAVSTAVFSYRKALLLNTMVPEEAFIKSFAWVVTAVASLLILAVIISSLRKNRPPAEAQT